MNTCNGCHYIETNTPWANLYAGHPDAAGNFVAAPGGSLVQQHAIDPRIQEVPTPEENIRSYRIAPSLLGAGFVEAIDDNTLIEIANEQVRQTGGLITGQVISRACAGSARRHARWPLWLEESARQFALVFG
jgi:hypothetical protein